MFSSPSLQIGRSQAGQTRATDPKFAAALVQFVDANSLQPVLGGWRFNTLRDDILDKGYGLYTPNGQYQCYLYSPAERRQMEAEFGARYKNQLQAQADTIGVRQVLVHMPIEYRTPLNTVV